MYAKRIEIKKLLMYTNEDAMIMLSLTNEHKGALYGGFYMHAEFLFSGIRNYTCLLYTSPSPRDS